MALRTDSTGTVGVDERGTSGIPATFELSQNYPNPFNPTTTIQYSLPRAGHVSLKVYNLIGQQVAVLVDQMEEAGYKSVAFNASNLSSGTYVIELRSGSLVTSKKLLLLK
jgi:hypothetical protein